MPANRSTSRFLSAGSVRGIALVFQAVTGTYRGHGLVRTVDDAQYENRLRNFDFDFIIDRWGQSLSPGNEQREFWGSQAADRAGSQNTIGIKNPAIDALIDQVIFAKDRADLVAATKALDRVLLWNFYVVPQFTSVLRATRAGTASAMPSRCRNTALRLSHACGGTMRRRRPDRQTILKDRSRMALLTRRHVLGLGIGALSAMRLAAGVAAENGEVESHGMSAFGDLKYPADFHHFDYVNPAAPKGGVFSLIPPNRAYNQSFFTFNSLNAYILKGEGAQGMDMTFASLMARASDEPDAMYGLAAKSVRISADKLNYRFTMRPEAKFHDGTKLTAHDVAFSLNALKDKGHPLILVQMRDLVKAEALDDATLVVTFAPKARARRAALCREPADLLQGLLRDAAVRRIHARYPARLGAVQGRQIRGQPLH